MDPQFYKRIFESQLPIVVNIPERNQSFQFLAGRLSYLTFLLPKINQLLEEMGEQIIQSDQTWFSFHNNALKWHYPFGLLYDQSIEGSGIFEIVLHLNNFPSDQLLSYDQAGFDHYMNTLKEADFIRNGNIKNILNMSANKQSQLWKALQECNETT
jgi:autophagy-related protein 5